MYKMPARLTPESLKQYLRIHLSDTKIQRNPIIKTNRLIQNSQNFSGLSPSSCIPKKHDVSETGSVSILS
jgi:hypothetical protein